MVRRSSYNSHLKRTYDVISRYTTQSENLISDIQKKQSLINRNVSKIKALKKKTRLMQSDIVNISKMQYENKRRGKLIKTKQEQLRKAEIQLQKASLKLKQPHFAPMSKKDKNGYFIRYRMHPRIIIADETIDDIVELIKDKVKMTSHMLNDKRRKHHMNITNGTVKNIRLIFTDEFGDFTSSVNVSSFDELKEKLVLEMNKKNANGGTTKERQIGKNQFAKMQASQSDQPLRLRGGAGRGNHPLPAGIGPSEIRQAQGIAYREGGGYDDGWYDRFLNAIDLFFYNGPNAVGCSTKLKKKYVFNLSHNELIHLYCPKSSKNKCFGTCLIKGIDIYSKKRAFDVRRKCNIKTDIKIDPKTSMAHQIADHLKVGYIVYHGIAKTDRMIGDSIEDSFKVYCKYGIDKYKTIISLIKIAGHCYLINDKTIYKRKCNKCGIDRKTGIRSDHKCSATKISYFQSKICKNPIMKCSKLRIEKEKNWVIFDLETLPCGPGETHMVYAVGWYDYRNDDYQYRYGKNAFNEFMQWTEQHSKGKTYMAYNGYRFDFYFIQNYIINSGNTPSFILNGGRLLSLNWGGETIKDGDKITIKNQNNVWDLCNFLVGFSLKNACKAFDTKCQKKEFDHARMHDWSCVYNEKNKKDCLHYLKYDVMSLVELTEKFVEANEEEFFASPTKYLTVPSFAENVWKSGLSDVIEIPDMEKQDFIRRSTYGGRTYPCRKRFRSKMYKTIMSNKSNTRKLTNIYKLLLESGDYIFNGDINSQYPACMAGCDLMPTLFPTGYSEWITDPKQAENIFYDNKQLGVYEIEFSCPNKQLRHAILPRKKIHIQKSGKQVFTGVEWSITDGKGTYNTVDIQNAIKHGYKIKFVGRALVWEGVSNTIFKSYVDSVYAKKVQATIDNNKVKRQVAKLMMNSLYGKTLQNPIKKHEAICKTSDEIESFLSQHKLTDWQIAENSDGDVDYVLFTGEKINEDRIAKKPTQLGTFVLSYSRRLWLMFLEAIDPTVQAEITTYLDTDSLHISGKHFNKLKNAGMIHDEKLGFLSNDCKDNALIINEINLSPKCYMYEALTENGEIKTTMKSKGIMKSKTEIVEHIDVEMTENGEFKTSYWKSIEIPILKKEWYELDQPQPANWTGMKKINKRVTSSDKLAGVQHFSIKKQSYNRTFNKSEWKGMKQDDGYFYPFGYVKV